ncbi:MAG: NIPSNAP family protein, partial [SAR202 cluster bacterium]|nr:NIPSNAP family protein [SAR202 cluster bacterium]
MIHEIRTYDLKPRSVPEFEKRTAAMIEGRKNYSQVGGFWSTEVGPLNQVVHIWPYEDLNARTEIRSKAVADGAWPPNNSELTLNMQSEIFFPAPFMPPLGDREIGPLYEMRIYTYAAGDIPKVVEAWGGAIEERQKYSPLAGAWYSDIGGLNKWV